MKKEKETPKKKDNMWIIVIVSMMLFIAGILYLDYTKNKPIQPPPGSPSLTTSPSPPAQTLYPPVLSEEIEAVMKSGDPVIMYFYSSECSACARAQPFVKSLEIRLETINLKLLKVSAEDNEEFFDLFGGVEYSTIIIFKEKEIYRQSVSITDNPDDVLAIIKQKLGIGR